MIEHTKSLSKLDSSDQFNQILVFWGPQFESAAAAIFVAQLRKLGLQVQVVCLNVQRTLGKNGLAIYYDMTLAKALTMVDHLSGVILPCRLMGIQRLKNDPRTARFFKKISINKIPIIIGQMDKPNLEKLRVFPQETINDLIMYPKIEELMVFVDQLAPSLWLRSDN